MTKSIEFPFLPVEAGNRLVLTGAENEKSFNSVEDWYFDEINSNGSIVAKYHVWDYVDIYPPHKADRSWEKTDLIGNVIAHGKQ
jgi:hypothetical protein